MVVLVMIQLNKGEFMKKIKILFIFTILLLTTGCLKKDNLEGISIITTNYPTEYVTNILYGEHSQVEMIYPNDTDTFNYTLTNKQINDYSSKDLLIYSGDTDDKELAYEFINKNKKMLIIDASYGIDITYGEAELWLNPSNLLMISQNVRNGLKEYLTNSYLEKEIDKNYENIKVILSELDAELKLTVENASKDTIVVNDDTLKFLEKYGLNVISLDSQNAIITEKTINDVNDLISSGKVKHIFTLENTKNSNELSQIITSTNIPTLNFRRLDSIKDEEKAQTITYEKLMTENIELLKKELYE